MRSELLQYSAQTLVRIFSTFPLLARGIFKGRQMICSCYVCDFIQDAVAERVACNRATFYYHCPPYIIRNALSQVNTPFISISVSFWSACYIAFTIST